MKVRCSLHGLFKSSHKAWVVGMHVCARGLLGMHKLSCAIFGLGSVEDGDLEASSDTLVHVEMVDELTSTEELLDLSDEPNGVTAVASATTVLNLHHVASFGVAEDFVWLRLHYYL